MKNEQRRKRTHRLIERGAILESYLEQPEALTNQQIQSILSVAFSTSETRAALAESCKATGSA